MMEPLPSFCIIFLPPPFCLEKISNLNHPSICLAFTSAKISSLPLPQNALYRISERLPLLCVVGCSLLGDGGCGGRWGGCGAPLPRPIPIPNATTSPSHTARQNRACKRTNNTNMNPRYHQLLAGGSFLFGFSARRSLLPRSFQRESSGSSLSIRD